jgi:regulator of replication initiation timing
MQAREESLQQELGERNQEVQAMRERLSGLQEKHNGLRLETLRLEQKVG